MASRVFASPSREILWRAINRLSHFISIDLYGLDQAFHGAGYSLSQGLYG